MKKSRTKMHESSTKRPKGPVQHPPLQSFTGYQSHTGVALHFSKLCIKLYMEWDQHTSVTGSTLKTTPETHD